MSSGAHRGVPGRDQRLVVFLDAREGATVVEPLREPDLCPKCVSAVNRVLGMVASDTCGGSARDAALRGQREGCGVTAFMGRMLLRSGW